MVIFFAGYPFSGKSFIIDLLTRAIPDDLIVISPRDFVDEKLYADLSENEKREMNIAAWEASLDMLYDQVKANKNDQIIIYDSACASYKRMFPYFVDSKSSGHFAIYAFIDADLSICEKRAGDKWLSGSIIDAYTMRFKENITRFAKLANKFIMIKNNSNDLPEVSKIIQVINNDRILKSS